MTHKELKEAGLDKTHCICPTCGRLFERNVGRGRPQERHPECRELAKAMNRVQKMMDKIQFADETKAKMMRGDLFRLANQVRLDKNAGHGDQLADSLNKKG